MRLSFGTRLVCAAALAAVAAGPVGAQSPAVAVEMGAQNDYFSDETVTLRVLTQAVEPAGAYVRGCAGHVGAEYTGAAIELLQNVDNLYFAADGVAVSGLVLGTPDGLYRCALADDSGFVSAQVGGPSPGRYTVWLAGPEAEGVIDGRLTVSRSPVSAIGMRGFDGAALGAPRSGYHVLSADAYDGRQLLASAQVISTDSLDQLSDSYCAGHGGLDAPDAVVSLSGQESALSLYAMSDVVDLTIAVLTPDGRWLCNDDTFGLNPAVTARPASAGDYLVFVGAYSQGSRGNFELFASVGEPQWGEASASFDAMPRIGYSHVETRLGGQRQTIASGPIVATDNAQLLGVSGCYGHIGIDAPDTVLTLDSTTDALSIYAMSDTDLVIAVRGPDGQILCDDDTFGLNPAVTFRPGQAGDYQVFVGAYSQGAQGSFELFATIGAPVWEEGGGLNHAAAPAAGWMHFGPSVQIDPRMILNITSSGSEAFGMGPDCAGYIDMSRPDVVLTVDGPLPQFIAYAVSDADGTMLVRTPSGQILCNDDYEGLNPAVVVPAPEQGDYAVWIGTYGGGGGVATFGVTLDNPLWVMDREH